MGGGQLVGLGTLSNQPKARSSAMALRGLKLFSCTDTYLPTAFAISVRHDPLARMASVSANSAINAASSSDEKASYGAYHPLFPDSRSV